MPPFDYPILPGGYRIRPYGAHPGWHRTVGTTTGRPHRYTGSTEDDPNKASLSEGGGRGDIRFTEIDEVGGSLPLT